MTACWKSCGRPWKWPSNSDPAFNSKRAGPVASSVQHDLHEASTLSPLFRIHGQRGAPGVDSAPLPQRQHPQPAKDRQQSGVGSTERFKTIGLRVSTSPTRTDTGTDTYTQSPLYSPASCSQQGHDGSCSTPAAPSTTSAPSAVPSTGAAVRGWAVPPPAPEPAPHCSSSHMLTCGSGGAVWRGRYTRGPDCSPPAPSRAPPRGGRRVSGAVTGRSGSHSGMHALFMDCSYAACTAS